ncbi:hypothetical protein BGX23_008600 [Mortierella sp. AD031]|nr:hypothetical protein BGX23_008600 [Mortierella sp. AD031]
MVAHAKVFKILELATLIADELSQYDLSLCCRVSKDWFDTFTPHLWHSITILPNDPVLKFQSPEGRAGLLRNGHHIRVLRTFNLHTLEPFVNLFGRFGGTTASAEFSSDVDSTGFAPAAPATGFGTAAPAVGFDAFPLSVSCTRRGFGGIPVGATSAAQILVSILERNPRLEFLVVPWYCLESEAVVKVVAESLLSLKEFFSPSELWAEWDPSSRFSFYDKSFSRSQSGRCAEPVVEGLIRSPRAIMPSELLKNYPRARELQLGISARINHEALERIRSASKDLSCLVISGGWPVHVAQILVEASGLTDITLDRKARDGMVDNAVRQAFLKHAPTLEYLNVSGWAFDHDILQAILCSSPFLKTVKTMEEYIGYPPSIEAELDAQGAIKEPWICDQLEVFECKITGVPRPDVTVISIYDIDHWIPDIPQETLQGTMSDLALIAQQESHALQRKVLEQLGRCTRLRKLRLGTLGRDWDNVEYSQLTIKGIRTMTVDEYVQRNCLELSLEGGLDELAGLKRLEELDVYQMAHRIGLSEVRWMVEHWPELKVIHGLAYYDWDDETLFEAGYFEKEEPEHIRWIRENRPDIDLPPLNKDE